ncbi:ComEC/Rec2 family competence protein [Sanguibacter massiliensis]|uniref:ComEC/Rec2 family competence protein n=1 Tax=Sanguibacter massiliensis TaxID=1973217 RepID=UPI000C82C866|nr:ComEC/Rec2 family competence protein [Sanguibacter massiliensis]
MTRTDVRLVPLAATVWLTAALLVGRTVPSVVVAGVAALAAAAAFARARRRRARRAGRTALPGVVLCLVGVVAVAGVVAADARAARSQLLAEAAHVGARVTVDVLVVGEPRALPSTWGGPARYAVDVRVEQVQTGAEGHARGAGALSETIAVPASLVGARWQDVVVGERVSTTVAVTARGHDGRRARYDLRGATAPRPVAPASAPRRVAHGLRAGLRGAVVGLPPDAAGLVPGIAVGDTSAVPDDLVDAMRTTGLTHLTAVSGAHFSLVGALVLAATAALRVPRVPRVVGTVAVLTGLVLLVGPDPSVLRAAGTGAIGLLALAVGRRGAAVPALAAGVVVLLLLDPWLARSAGLALSVAATTGLVVGGPLVLAGLHGARRWLLAAVAAPALAQLACAPVLVLLAPSLATWSLPANVVAAPVVAPTTILGLGATLVAPVSPGAAVRLAALAGHGASWIAGTARTFAAWPGASLPWLPGPAGAGLLVLVEASLVALVVVRVRRARGVGGSWDP